MLYPAYSMNLAPFDYYLFWSIAHILCSWYSNNQEEVEASVKEFFTLKDKSWYDQRNDKKVALDGSIQWLLL